ncbi:MAG: PQQ-binding-like beta-propeller repeat protein [Planctomycetaceae bacterium]
MAPVEESVLPADVVDESEPITIYNVPSLKLLWEAQAVINKGRDKVAHIALDEEVVFVQSSAGVVTALNTESGRRFWSAQVGRNDEVSMKATSDSQMVAVVVGPVIHAFDKFSGQKLFAFRLDNAASGAPLITRREIAVGNRIDVIRHIFVPTSDKSVVAYDVEQLQYLGTHGTLKDGVIRALDWRFATAQNINFAPIAGQERLAFATDVGNIYVMDMTGIAKGNTRFEFLMNSATTAPLSVVTRDDNEYLLAACENNRLFCIALQTDGKMLWTIPMSHPVTHPISVVGDDVFVVTTNRELLKFNLRTGQPAKISRGVLGVASQTEGNKEGEEVLPPVFGASVSAECNGLLAHEPVRISNNSTGQMVNSITLDLRRSKQAVTFAADGNGSPLIYVSDGDREATGMRPAELSEDGKVLTIEFTDFSPSEAVSFYPDVVHPEIPAWKLTHSVFTGCDFKSMVSPIRAAAASVAGESRPFPPREVIGQLIDVAVPWRVGGVKSLVAIYESTVYYVDLNDHVVSVGREHGGSPVVTPTRDYTIHINNSLTDRVFLSTASGRVACFTESRIRVSAMPLPIFGPPAWLIYPSQEVTPEPAAYYQIPQNRPISTEVPEKDPAPAPSAAE